MRFSLKDVRADVQSHDRNDVNSVVECGGMGCKLTNKA
jgi:hypothetical protein